MELKYDSTYLVYVETFGWLAAAGFTSVWRDAKRFSREQAIEYCIRRRTPDGIPAFPVSVDALEEVAAK